MFIVTVASIVFVSILCWVLVVLCSYMSVLSSYAIIPLGKRELVALLLLSSVCHVAVIAICFLLTVQWVGRWCVIVEFSGHIQLYFNKF